MFDILIKLYVWSICSKICNTGWLSQVYCQLKTFLNGLTLKRDPLLSPQSELIIMYKRQCFDVNVCFLQYLLELLDISLSTHHPTFCIFYGACTPIYWLSKHRFTWGVHREWYKPFKKAALIFLFLLIFTMRPTSSEALELKGFNWFSMSSGSGPAWFWWYF